MTNRLNVPAVTVEQMKEVDRLMIEEYGILLIQMMENAGRALAALVASVSHGVSGGNILLLVGSGNNGGGGLVAARHLSNMGFSVKVVLSTRIKDLQGVPAHQASALTKMGIELLEASKIDTERLAMKVGDATIIVDALLGYSLSGAPHGEAARLIRAANASGRPVVALDVPSGISATNGCVYEPSIRARTTLTLALPKTALSGDQARDNSGDLYLGDISVPSSPYHRLGLDVGLIFADPSPIRLSWTTNGWEMAGNEPH